MALGIAGSGWAAITACAGAANGTTLTTLGTTAANGCGSVDLSFDNLAISGASATGAGIPVPTTGNIAMYSTGTGASGNTVGPVNALFDGDGLANNWNLTAGTDSQAVTISYLSQAHTGGTYNGGANTYPSPTNGLLHWAYSGLDLVPTFTVSCAGAGGCTAPQQIVITETFCIGATSTTLGTGGCTAAERGTITATMTGTTVVNGAGTLVYACASGADGTCVSATSNHVNFATAFQFTNIAISDSVSLTRTTGNTATVTLTNFENQFLESADAPEPATFSLLGGALAGLGTIAYRKRKLQLT